MGTTSRPRSSRGDVPSRARYLALASRTQKPIIAPGEVRIGGFGGFDGRVFLSRASGVDAIIDATHAFAVRISANAVRARDRGSVVPHSHDRCAIAAAPRHAVVIARPCAVSDELALMRAHAIDVVVTKNSDGDATASKLEAARTLGIPVVVIGRPQAIRARTVAGIEAAVAGLESLHSSRASAR